MSTEIFETDNIYQASTITCITENPPSYKDTDGMVHFTYPATAKVMKAAQDFFSGVEVNVYLYSMILKKLRGEMMARRKGINGNLKGSHR